MTNHVHIALQVGEIPLSRIMQNLSLRYTTWINRRRKRTGHVFQGRYKRWSVSQTASIPLATPLVNASYDEANEMLSHDGSTFTYDLNGNLETKTDTCGATSYTWDGRNRLAGISGFRDDCSQLSASFNYDALNRRVEKTVDGITTQYVYDGRDIIQESTNGVTTNYTRNLNIDEPLAFERSDGTVRYFKADALGSVIALTDGNGVVTTSYAYDAFGNVTASGSDVNPFQYAGRENDGTGLYYYRARYYSPGLRRFISEDPIRLLGGINYFVYVQNNPVNRLDPTGLAWVYDTGTNTLQQTDSSGNVTNSWPAGSGPWGNGQLPPGTYTLPSPPVTVPPNHPNQPSYCDGSGNCWWQPITPNFPTNRTGLGIHPDGNVPGTAGCIGATDNDTNSLRDALMNDQGPLTVR
jgi:RHS repeat-associated protein